MDSLTLIRRYKGNCPNDEEEEWDDNIECDIEWSEIRDRLIEEW